MLFVIIFFSFSSTARGDDKTPEVTVKLYFPKQDGNDPTLVAVTRRIPRTRKIADAALRALFAGPNETERKDNLDSAFFPESIILFKQGCSSKNSDSLSSYYLGVKIRRGTAIVNFRRKAGCYLQTSAAMQDRILSPIIATLKQFKMIKEVEFALDGKVITEWDA